MIVTTINVNGIRAAVKERSTENLGLLAWLKETRADVVCLQETRADDDQLAEALAPALADGWHLASADPHLKGRNGVAVLSRHPIDRTSGSAAASTNSPRTAATSRWTPRVSPSAASTFRPVKPRPTASWRRNASWLPSPRGWHVLRCDGRDAVLCGDWNIAHTENDIKAWKANRKKAGFLPSERQWLTDLLATGWVDVVRRAAPRRGGPLQLVVMAGQGVRQRRRLAHRLPAGHRRVWPARVVAARRRTCRALTRLRWSDHAPVTVEYG